MGPGYKARPSWWARRILQFVLGCILVIIHPVVWGWKSCAEDRAWRFAVILMGCMSKVCL